MEQQFTLRNATINDSAFFYDVKKTVLKKYIEEIWGWNETFQIKFHEENFHVNETKIIELNHQPIGTVEVKEDDERIFLCSLYILPLYQNKKIGSTICKIYMHKAEKEKKIICLEVLKLNVNAQRLYLNLGFTQTEKNETKYFMFKNFLAVVSV
ncbi:MAG: GNAT family N-acetyltransferase [Bacteroidetes bacterium]|nr:GNAT family N-acetyltransferase [Bacteroidota bacterium]